MRVRQLFDLYTTRTIADEDPLPIRSLLCGTLDQFLVHQPWLDRAKVSETWMGNLFDFMRN